MKRSIIDGDNELMVFQIIYSHEAFEYTRGHQGFRVDSSRT